MHGAVPSTAKYQRIIDDIFKRMEKSKEYKKMPAHKKRFLEFEHQGYHDPQLVWFHFSKNAFDEQRKGSESSEFYVGRRVLFVVSSGWSGKIKSLEKECIPWENKALADAIGELSEKLENVM